MSLYRPALRTLAAAGLATGLLAAGAAPAAAHVGLDPTHTGAGESSVLTFGFGHGCDGSPTTGLEILIPEEVTIAEPLDSDGWTHETNTAADGDRVETIVFTADAPVPDHDEASVQVQIRVPEAEPGTVLEFGTVQVCTEGESAWVQTTTDGTEPDYPAPAFTVTEGPEVADDVTDEATPDPSDTTEPAASTTADEGVSTWVWIVIGVAVIVVASGLVLLRRRRREG